MQFITRTSSLICLYVSLFATVLSTSTAYSSQGVHGHGGGHHERVDSYDDLPSLTLIVDKGNMVHMQHLTYTAMDHILKHLHDFYEFSFVESTQEPLDYASLSAGVDLLLIQSSPESVAGEHDFIWTLSYKDESYVSQHKVLALIDFLHKDDIDPAVSNFFAVMNSMTQTFNEMLEENLSSSDEASEQQADHTEVHAKQQVATDSEADLTTMKKQSLNETTMKKQSLNEDTLEESSPAYATIETHAGDHFYSATMDLKEAVHIVAALSWLMDSTKESAFYTFHINDPTTGPDNTSSLDGEGDTEYIDMAMSDLFGVSYKYLGDELVYSIDEPSEDKAVIIATYYSGIYNSQGNQHIQTLILNVSTQQLYDHLETLLNETSSSLSNFYSHVMEALDNGAAEANETAAAEVQAQEEKAPTSTEMETETTEAHLMATLEKAKADAKTMSTLTAEVKTKTEALLEEQLETAATLETELEEAKETAENMSALAEELQDKVAAAQTLTTQEAEEARPAFKSCATQSSADGLFEQLLDFDSSTASITFQKVIDPNVDGQILYCFLISEYHLP